MRGGIVVLAVGALLIAGCGSESETADSGDSEKPEAAQEAKPKPKPKAAAPVTCLEDAGLENAEKRDADLWRAMNPSGGLVRVSSFGSPSEAARAAAEATDVQAVEAGRYAVFGGLKGSDDGAAVKAVAACLGG